MTLRASPNSGAVRWLIVASGAAVTFVIAGLAAASVMLYRPASFPKPSAGRLAGQVTLSAVRTSGVMLRSPVSSARWNLVGVPGLPRRDAESCRGVSRQWRDAEPTVWVSIIVLRCPDLESAREVQWYQYRSFRANYGAAQIPAVIPDAVQGTAGAFLGWPTGQYQVIDFRRGIYYVDTAAFLAASRTGTVSALIRAVAFQQWLRLSGPPGAGAQSFTTLVTDQLSASVSVTLILLLAGRSAIGAIRRRAGRSAVKRPWLTGTPDQWAENEPYLQLSDVTQASRHLSTQSRWALIMWALAAYFLGAAITEDSSSLTATAAVLVIAVGAAAGAALLNRRVAATLRPAGWYHLDVNEAAWCALSLSLFAVGLLSAAIAFSPWRRKTRCDRRTAGADHRYGRCHRQVCGDCSSESSRGRWPRNSVVDVDGRALLRTSRQKAGIRQHGGVKQKSWIRDHLSE